jgi:hypothetical protein
MPKVVKYGNFALENLAVTLEAFRNSHIGLRTASREYNFRKIHEGSLRRNKITLLFVCIGQEFTFNMQYFMKTYDFSRSLQFTILSAPLRVLWPTSVGRESSKQCFMLRALRMFYCEYILQLYVNRGQLYVNRGQLYVNRGQSSRVKLIL